jgi:hypothetical protein
MKRFISLAMVSVFSLFLSCRACHRVEEQQPAQAAIETTRPQEQAQEQPQAQQEPVAPAPALEESPPSPAPQNLPMTPGAVIPLTGSAKQDEYGWARNKRDQQVQAALHQIYLYQQQTQNESKFATLPAPPPAKENDRVSLKKGAPPPADLVPVK